MTRSLGCGCGDRGEDRGTMRETTQQFYAGFRHGLALQGWAICLPIYLIVSSYQHWKRDRPQIDTWRLK